jgi:hypothetical protein
LEPDKRIAAELPPKQTYREFVQTYEESERREKKQRFQDKIRISKMIEKIKSKVVADDLSRRDIIMSCRTSTREARDNGLVPILLFRSPAVDVLVRHCVHRPSECRATEAQEIADNTSGYLETIDQSQWISFACMLEIEPFEIKLKQYCQEKYQDFDSFICQLCRPNFFQNSFKRMIL